MKGTLFEVLAAYLFRINDYDTFLKESHSLRLDIIAEKKIKEERWLIECKAYSKKSYNNLYSEAKKFLKKLFNSYEKEPKLYFDGYKSVKACFISLHKNNSVIRLVRDGKTKLNDKSNILQLIYG